MSNAAYKTNQSPDKNRIYLYDNLKFFAILLVVIGHALDFLTSKSGNHLEKSLYLTIYSVHMPLFVFISGLFLKPMNAETKFPKQKVLYFLLLGVVLRAMVSLFRLILGKKPNFAILDMYDSFAWFVGAMAAFITIVWIFRNSDKKAFFFLAVFIGCMAGYDKFLGDELALMRITVFFPFFLAGYMLTPEKIFEVTSRLWIKIASAGFIAGIIAVFFCTNVYSYLRPMFTGRNSFSVLGQYYNFGIFVRIACYLISAAFVISLISLIPRKRLTFVSDIGTKTLQIYFWHKFFLLFMEYLNLYAKIESVTGGTLATAIYILLAIAVAFICSLPIFSFPSKQLLSFTKRL